MPSKEENPNISLRYDSATTPLWEAICSNLRLESRVVLTAAVEALLEAPQLFDNQDAEVAQFPAMKDATMNVRLGSELHNRLARKYPDRQERMAFIRLAMLWTIREVGDRKRVLWPLSFEGQVDAQTEEADH